MISKLQLTALGNMGTFGNLIRGDYLHSLINETIDIRRDTFGELMNSLINEGWSEPVFGQAGDLFAYRITRSGFTVYRNANKKSHNVIDVDRTRRDNASSKAGTSGATNTRRPYSHTHQPLTEKGYQR